MKEDKRKKDAFRWQKEQTTQYNLRFMNATGVPQAIERATIETGETTAEYLKNGIICRLRNDGFLAKEEKVVLNLNKQRHIEKLKKLETYLEQEKKKIK